MAKIYGITHWALWDEKAIPKYEVIKYIGEKWSRHIFKSVTGSLTLMLTEENFSQLVAIGRLRPFCLQGGKTEGVYAVSS